MKVSDRVLCVNDYFTEELIQLIPNRPRKDLVYTIADVLLTRNGRGLILEEIVNPPLLHPSGGGTFQASFNISRFRLIDDVEDLVEELTEEAVC